MRSFYTFFLDSLWIALRSIFTHRLRSFLTLIGIIIGVASVVIVGASIDGLNAYVQETVLRVFGVNHFIVSRFVFEKRMTDEEIKRMIRRNKPLTAEDLKRLADNCPTCAEVGVRALAD